ncbi:MAG: dihydropteroate synthase [Bacteriovoracaceae bacterium]
MSSPRNLLMGIINITPNSFSDGGSYNDRTSFYKRLNYYLNHSSVDMIDIGAESTASFNESISAQSELDRFRENLFPFLQEIAWPSSKMLSIDTQKIKTITDIVAFIKSLDKKIEIIWNDISGSLDDETLNFLKLNPKIRFVLTHNFCQKRDELSNHISFTQKISAQELYFKVVTFFEEAKLQFLKNGIELSRIYFDPGFGFAKNREQNLYLMDQLASLIMRVNHPQWLIAMSRKSFLRESGLERSRDPLVIEATEIKLLNYLINLTNELRDSRDLVLTHRVHEPSLYENLK